MGARPEINQRLKLFGITIAAILLIASVAYLTISFLIPKPFISLSLRIKDVNGNPIEKGIVYAWALMPNNASMLIGGFEIKDGRVCADIEAPMRDVAKEWIRYFGGESNITDSLTPLMPSIWMAVSYPGGIYSGITVLYNPLSMEKEGGELSRDITVPTSVDYSKPVAELLESKSTYYEGESWVPIFIIGKNGDAYVCTNFVLGGMYYYSKASWILTPEVETIEDISSLLASDVTYYIGENVMGHSGTSDVGLLTLSRLNSVAVLIKARWAYEEHVYKIDYESGTKYIGEARICIKEFLRESSDLLAVNINQNYNYSWIKSFGEAVTFNSYEGQGVVDLSDPEWTNKMQAYGDSGVIPKIREDNIFSMETLKRMVCLPLGHEISKEVRDLNTMLNREVISFALVAIDYEAGTDFLMFKCYSDAPEGIEYDVKYVVLDSPYKYYDNNLEELKGKVNNLEELKGKVLVTVCLEFSEKT